MSPDIVTLTELLGKPEFQPPKRMEGLGETTIRAHVQERRSTAHFPVTTDDLTTLLERHVDELDVYANMSPYGSGVEGLTVFRSRQKPIVKISATLSDGLSERRLRSTLAHEFGHVVLHDPIFQRKTQERLFDLPREVLQVCKPEGMGVKGDLYEYQAWYLCGAVLAPFTELKATVSQVTECVGHFSEIYLYSDLGEAVVEIVGRQFDLSREFTKIRLLKAGLVTEIQPSPTLF